MKIGQILCMQPRTKDEIRCNWKSFAALECWVIQWSTNNTRKSIIVDKHQLLMTRERNEGSDSFQVKSSQVAFNSMWTNEQRILPLLIRCCFLLTLSSVTRDVTAGIYQLLVLSTERPAQTMLLSLTLLLQLTAAAGVFGSVCIERTDLCEISGVNISRSVKLILSTPLFSTPFHDLFLLTWAVLSQRNRAMQRVFPTPNESLIVICFSSRKVKAVIAPAVICRLKAEN